MKILLYTHSDYSWVWKFWHQQTDKYLYNFEKICFLDSKMKFRDDYLVFKYDDQKSYKERVISCLDKLNDEEIVLFTHEDMFLYKKPNFQIINEYEELISNDKCHVIKLVRAFENLEKSPLHKNLLINPHNQLFSIQPSLIKVKNLKHIFNNVPGKNIWEFEGNTNREYLNKIISLCSFNQEQDLKRGKFHYNSYVYPYICTAVIKGKWNFKEYKKELYEIFYNKRFNYFKYFLSKFNLI